MTNFITDDDIVLGVTDGSELDTFMQSLSKREYDIFCKYLHSVVGLFIDKVKSERIRKELQDGLEG